MTCRQTYSTTNYLLIVISAEERSVMEHLPSAPSSIFISSNLTAATLDQ